MDAELWTAVAVSVIGPTAAVTLGVVSFWLREERQKASQRYLDDGAVKLLKVISARLIDPTLGRTHFPLLDFTGGCASAIWLQLEP